MRFLSKHVIAAHSAVFFLFVIGTHSAFAQHVWIDPRAEGRITLTDNANLTEANRIQDAVLNVSPAINIRVEGARTRAAIDYAFDYLYFLSDGGTDTRHNLFGTLESEVWEDHLTLQGRASMRQQYLDQRGSLSNNFANRTDNRRMLQNYTGTAIMRGGLKDFADWRATYRFGISETPADNLDDDTLTTNFSDTVSHEVTLSLGSGKRFNNFEWRLFADSSRVQRSLDVNDFRNEHAGAELTYKFSRFFSLIGSIGYSRNNFQSEELSEDGLSWEGGFRWTPGRKLDLEVRHGREGKRKTWYGTLRHFFTVRFDFTGSYQDTITANSIITNDSLQDYRFDEDIGIRDGQGLPVDESDPRFSFSDVDFRRRVAQGTFTLRQKRTQWYVSGNMEWRTFDDDSGTARSEGISGGFEHKINEKTSLSGSVGYRRSRFEDQTRVDDFITANLDWTKTVSRYFRIAVGYAHSERQSTEQGSDLEENSLTFYIRGTF